MPSSSCPGVIARLTGGTTKADSEATAAKAEHLRSKESQASLEAAQEAAKAEAKAASDLEGKLQALIEDGQGEALKGADGRLTLQLVGKVLFKSGEAELSKRGQRVMARVGRALKEMQDKQVWVRGHTDNVSVKKGKDRFPSNWELSALRALTVVHFLEDESKVDPKRLAAAAFGSHRPVQQGEESTHRDRSLSTGRHPQAPSAPSASFGTTLRRFSSCQRVAGKAPTPMSGIHQSSDLQRSYSLKSLGSPGGLRIAVTPRMRLHHLLPIASIVLMLAGAAEAQPGMTAPGQTIRDDAPSRSQYLAQSQEPVERTVTYGWHVFAADAATWTLFASADGSNGDGIAALGTAGLFLGGPLVHLAHGNPGSAGYSLLARFGMPTGGALLFMASCDDSDSLDCLGSMIAGTMLGYAGALAVDWFILAEKTEMVAPPTGWASLRPSLNIRQDGAEAGIAFDF
ncbi:MAG: OmpA family protein [Myxococcales bacterium]|nr:OmpA family protein [Myxococcales bacterium]